MPITISQPTIEEVRNSHCMATFPDATKKISSKLLGTYLVEGSMKLIYLYRYILERAIHYSSLLLVKINYNMEDSIINPNEVSLDKLQTHFILFILGANVFSSSCS